MQVVLRRRYGVCLRPAGEDGRARLRVQALLIGDEAGDPDS